MKNLNLWITLFATMLFAACGGDDFPTKPPYENLPSGSFQLSIAKVVEAQTQVTVTISSKGTASYGYIIEPHTSTTTEYSGEQVYAAGIPIGAMGNFDASEYKGWGYTWHNRNKDYGLDASKINSYLNSGMEVSVYTLDNETEFAKIESYFTKLRGITTNYPKWLLDKY